MGGLFFNSTVPLLFEMAVESVYPISEAVAIIIMLFLSSVFYSISTITFMFPGANTTWMNWSTVLSCGICVPGLVIYKAKFKRLDVDEDFTHGYSKTSK